jgi:hypothetical protein
MGTQPGWPDFLLIAPAIGNYPAGLIHALELKRRGETMSEEQEAFAAWCTEKGVPHACVDDLREALAVLSD